MLSSLLVKFAVLLILAGLTCSRGFAQNVLLFTVDSCRRDRITPEFAPNIARWATKGIVFENAYSTSAWTAPGLVSILTGLYPPTHGVNNRDHMGSPDLVTLIKVFQKLGYRVPNLNFFTFAPYYQNLGLPAVAQEYFGTDSGDELLNWLTKNTGGSPPFFAWYHTTLAHQPYRPRPEELPLPLEELLKSPGLRAVLSGAIVPKGSTSFSEADRPLIDRLYNGEIGRVDRLFKKTLDLLETKDLRKNTLIVFTADHGEELLDHYFVGHASTSLEAKLYEEIVRIPLILSWPDRIPGGRRVSRPVNQTDIFPTILELFKIPVPKFVQGISLLTRKALKDRPIFFESVIAGNQTTKEKEDLWIRAIRSRHHKFISNGELYDLRSDPGEKRNLLSRKPELAARLRRELEKWHQNAVEEGRRVFPEKPLVYAEGGCPRVFTPEKNSVLSFDAHTGMILFDWSGDKNTTYLLEYDIGVGDHHVAGTYEVTGNHQLLGPLNKELWDNLKAWNPFKFRVAPKSQDACWSDWVNFNF
ncbi:MAG: sulfatase [Acidobacteria bacterium]|nr:sulfatase [Acidobacteriota bacterium]